MGLDRIAREITKARDLIQEKNRESDNSGGDDVKATMQSYYRESETGAPNEKLSRELKFALCR